MYTEMKGGKSEGLSTSRTVVLPFLNISSPSWVPLVSPPVILLCFSLSDCLLTSSVIHCFLVTFLCVFQIPCFFSLTVLLSFVHSLVCVPPLCVSFLQPFFSVLTLLSFLLCFCFFSGPFSFLCRSDPLSACPRHAPLHESRSAASQ